MKVAGRPARRCAAIARPASLAGAALGVGIGVLALWSGAAAAAGTGGSYGGGGPEGTPPGTFTVITSQTVPKTGGTVTGTHDGQKISVVVPATTFTTKVQVTLLVPTLSDISGAVSSFEISFSMNGTVVTKTFTKTVVATITASAIKAGDVVDEWDQTAWVAYPHATVSTGTAKITMTSDPAFAVETASTSATTTATTSATATTSTTAPADTTAATVTGTSATTGIPVLGITLGSTGLLAGGGVSLLYARRRRQSATRS